MEKTVEKNTEMISMLGNTMNVLDYLIEANGSLGVNEIAKKCELSPSTCFRILKTLEASGWAFQLSDDRYIPGETIRFLTADNNSFIALQEVSTVIMEYYAKKYHQPMNLMVLDGDSVFVLQQARTENILDYISPKYSRVPFYQSACGKVILSEAPVYIVDELLRRTEFHAATLNTISNPDAFWKELRRTAKRGYAFNHHESTPIGSAIAVPIRDNTGKMIASLSFCGFVGIEDPEQMLEYLPPLREAADAISRTFSEVFCKTSF